MDDAIAGAASGLRLLLTGSRLGLRIGAWTERPDPTVFSCFPECSDRVPVRIPSYIRFVSGSSQRLEHGHLVHRT